MVSKKTKSNDRENVSKALHTHEVEANQSNLILAKLQSRLRLFWILWLAYRGVILPILIGIMLSTKPNIIAGIAFQVMWLIPAILLSTWLVKGKSAYALLVSSMITLLYLGSSGVVLFSRFYSVGIELIWIYIIDFMLLLLVNFYLFKVLKSLPSMNG